MGRELPSDGIGLRLRVEAEPVRGGAVEVGRFRHLPAAVGLGAFGQHSRGPGRQDIGFRGSQCVGYRRLGRGHRVSVRYAT